MSQAPPGRRPLGQYPMRGGRRPLLQRQNPSLECQATGAIHRKGAVAAGTLVADHQRVNAKGPLS